MPGLSATEQKTLDELAHRHGFPPEAVARMLDAIARGGGGMAQFDHPAFGGYGQWMRGGMTMIGDMFNQDLKRRVTALCDELAVFLAREPETEHGESTPEPAFSPFQRNETSPVPHSHTRGSAWWPDGLGSPDSSGAQNGSRYAYFATARRLAIETDGVLTLYDTGAHRIGGVAQQQSSTGSLTFTSQHGPVDAKTLAVVSGKAGATGEGHGDTGPIENL